MDKKCRDSHAGSEVPVKAGSRTHLNFSKYKTGLALAEAMARRVLSLNPLRDADKSASLWKEGNVEEVLGITGE